MKVFKIVFFIFIIFLFFSKNNIFSQTGLSGIAGNTANGSSASGISGMQNRGSSTIGGNVINSGSLSGNNVNSIGGNTVLNGANTVKGINVLQKTGKSINTNSSNPLFLNKKSSEFSEADGMIGDFTLQNEISGKTSLNKISSNGSLQVLEISTLEKNYLKRLKNKTIHLKQFGYNFFIGKPKISLSVSVGKDYILGPGDELFLYVIGSPPGIDLSSINKLVVDREGKVYLPGLGVFYVWGKTLGKAEKLISNALKANIKLTVGRLRTFPVYVSGEVRKPGAVIATGVSTVIDAIIMAGGIKYTGTLRDVIVTRKVAGKIKKYHIDFYKLLLKGEQIDFRLKDGDVIFVKTIGNTVGITGIIKRPGIYELKGKTTLKQLVHLAGGLQPSSYKIKVVLQRYKDNLFLQLEQGQLDDKKFMSKYLKDGDILSIKQILLIPNNAVEIANYTTYPGLYEYKKGMKLSQLLSPDLFFKDSNMNFGLIERQFPSGSLPEYVTFSPTEIISKKSDIILKPSDKIYLFKYNFTRINVIKVKNIVILKGNIKTPGIYAYKKGLKLSDIVSLEQLLTNTNRNFAVIKRVFPFGSPPRYLTFSPENIFKNKKDLSLMPGDTVIFYSLGERNIDFNKIKNVVILEGEILYPGVFAYIKGMKLSEIFKKSMLTLNTDLSYAEIERRDPETYEIKNIFRVKPEDVISGKADVKLHPLDIVRFFPKYVQAPIKITGKVEKPIILPYHYNMKLTYALAKAKFTDNIKNLKVEIYRKVSKEKSKNALEIAQNIKGKATTSAALIKENLGTIYLYDILLEKNKSFNITLNPGDRIVVKSVGKDELIEKIALHGYVVKPGVYPIKDTTTLYDILKQAGGFREKAYPQGIVILRKSVKKLQEERLSKAIIEMRKQIEKEEAGVMQSDLSAQELQGRQAAFEAKRKLLEEMQKTQVTGRITGVIIPHDIEKLKGTIYNILLENGDEIFIPQIPSNVVIFGEVYNPSAILYRDNFNVKDYISMSGGLTKDADKENIFVIKADGSVISSANVNSDKFWEGRNLPEWGKPEEYSTDILEYKLEPGDGIIVPTEVHIPTMWRPLIKDVTQIIYQGALTLYTISNLK